MNDKEKRKAFEQAFAEGKVRVLFDTHDPNVGLPPEILDLPKEDGILAFDYSKNFTMPDFKVTGDGILATLEFGGVPQLTFVPWSSVRVIAMLAKVANGSEKDDQPKEDEIPIDDQFPDFSKDDDTTFEIDAEDRKWLSTTVAES
jgi:hypothetical protein